MHVFISAGEPSGDLHAANLARAIRAKHPHAKVVGFGGDKLKAAGAEVLYPLTELAVMWIGKALANLPTFFRVAKQAKDYFETHKPDAVVLIDYPGFHWHIAKRAKAAGIPVYYFVPPQLWAWMGWRVKKMRRSVDTVLTALPFEETWYAERGVNTQYVGHPYFDDLARQQLNAAFIDESRGRTIVGLLPGSRNQEVANNWPVMLNAAKRIHVARPDVTFHVAAFKEAHAEAIRAQTDGLPIEVHVGRTPEIIELSTACIAVSGSVSLEILYRRKPAAVVYRGSRVLKTLARMLMTCKYITLVNLLANEELYPEFQLTHDDEPKLAATVLRWLNDPVAHAEFVAKLTAVRAKVAVPGACERAATAITQKVAARLAA